MATEYTGWRKFVMPLVLSRKAQLAIIGAVISVASAYGFSLPEDKIIAIAGTALPIVAAILGTAHEDAAAKSNPSNGAS